ncbi:hypothetical protein ECG_03129 [Echinococcus granulosus]|nr:hypothetical protein ECG_03129 [Echinococcus granulosus]
MMISGILQVQRQIGKLSKPTWLLRLRVIFSRCVQVPDPKTRKPASLCFNDDLWNITGSTSGWQTVRVDLTSVAKSDFQVANPKGGKATSVCFSEDIWNTTGPTSGWKTARVDLTSVTKNDFQVFVVALDSLTTGNRCVQVPDPMGGKTTRVCFNDDLWNASGPASDWQNAKVDLTSAAKTDFQCFDKAVTDLVHDVVSLHSESIVLIFNKEALFIRGCVQVPHPITGKLSSVCSNDDLWNASGPTSGWQKAKVDLTSAVKSDFQRLHSSYPSKNREAYNSNEDIWKTTGSTLGWQNAKIDLTSAAKSDFQIILEGVIPAGYPDARICVDNITSYTVPCSELEPKPVKPSTATYTWAQYFGITFIVALAFGLLIPVLFLVGIIVVCRRRHAYRHHHCMTNGSGGGMSVSGAGSGSYGNSKLFSANLWHYIGGKEVADDPFAEHTASIHRPPFSAHKFSDGTLGMRGDGTLDLPDVVIPSGRVVGGTLIRQTSQPAYNGAPYGYQTMVTTGKAMRYNGVPMGPPSNMLASQPNFTMDFNSQSAMPNMVQQGNQQMMIPTAGAPAPSQVMVQTDAAQQMMVQPANYFQSLAQPATPLSGSGAQPAMVAPAAAPAPAATGAITMTTSAVPVAAPAGANIAMDDNGPFVLPDPPSDHQQERDQVAAALDALNAATEPPQPRQTTSAAAVASGEHPPPGYDEAVGMAITRPAGGADAAAAAPVLPPRRTAPANNAAVAAESLSLAQRYGLPVAEI